MPEKNFQLNEQNISIVREIGKHMPGGFFIYRAKQPEELLYANEAVFDIFGCDDLEDFKRLTGYTFRGMLHPQDYEKVAASINQQIRDSEEKMDYAEYRIIRKDGAVRWVDDYGHFTETEAYGGIYYVFISDITEKRERMESDQKKYRKELNNMITAMASDYRSVYHVDLDADDAVCYRVDPEDAADREGDHFSFHRRFQIGKATIFHSIGGFRSTASSMSTLNTGRAFFTLSTPRRSEARLPRKTSSPTDT